MTNLYIAWPRAGIRLILKYKADRPYAWPTDHFPTIFRKPQKKRHAFLNKFIVLLIMIRTSNAI